MEDYQYEFIGNWRDVEDYLSGYKPEKGEAVIINIEHINKEYYGVKITSVYEEKETDQPYVEPFK